MYEDSLSTLPGAGAPPGPHPSPVLLDVNVGPSPEQAQAQTQLFQGIRTMCLRLLHPSSRDVLPSPTNK
jgi:hypothetical protein